VSSVTRGDVRFDSTVAGGSIDLSLGTELAVDGYAVVDWSDRRMSAGG
jgi:hypothetical protein